MTKLKIGPFQLHWLLTFTIFVMTSMVLCSCGDDDGKPPASIPFRFAWAPDATKAALIASDGFHIVQPNGHLSKSLSVGNFPFAWMPDSEHVVYVAEHPIDSWDELKTYLSNKQISEIVANYHKSKNTLSHYKDLAAYVKSLELEDQKTQAIADQEKREKRESKLVKKSIDSIGVFGNDWLKVYVASKDPSFLTKLNSTHPTVNIDGVNISGIAGEQLVPSPMIFGSFGKISYLRCSPDGREIAIVYAKGDDEFNTLQIASLDGKSQQIAQNVADQVDWLPDSKSVAYMKYLDNEKGAIHLRMVEPDGKKGKDLKIYQTNISDCNELRCSRSGRQIYFSGSLSTLPKTKNHDVPTFDQFISCVQVDDSMNETKDSTSLRSANSPTADRYHFEISPDDRKIAVIDAEGMVDITDIDGKNRTVLQSQSFSHLPSSLMVPQWRNNSEVSFCAKLDNPVNERGSELRVWNSSSNNFQPLSQGWPEEATEFMKLYGDVPNCNDDVYVVRKEKKK